MIDVCVQNYINGERCLKIKDGCLVCCCHENPGEPNWSAPLLTTPSHVIDIPKLLLKKGKTMCMIVRLLRKGRSRNYAQDMSLHF